MGTRRKRRWRKTVKTRAAVLAAFAALLVLTPADVANIGSESDRASVDRDKLPANGPGWPASDMPAEVMPVMNAG